MNGYQVGVVFFCLLLAIRSTNKSLKKRGFEGASNIVDVRYLAGSYFVFLSFFFFMWMVPGVVVVAHLGLVEEVNQGKAYIGNHRVEHPSEVYLELLKNIKESK